MKKRKLSQKAKIFLSILFVFFSVIFVLQVISVLVMEADGVYYYGQDEVTDNQMESLASQASREILYEYVNTSYYQGEEEAMKNCTFNYANSNYNFIIIKDNNEKDGFIINNIPSDEKYSYKFTSDDLQLQEETYSEYDYSMESMYYADTETEVTYASYDYEGPDYTRYSVRCYIGDKLSEKDACYYQQKFIEFAYVIKYWIIVTTALSIGMVLILFVILMKNAGRRNEENEIQLRWLDKIPLDIYMLILTVIAFIQIYMAENFGSSYGLLDSMSIQVAAFAIGGILAVIDSAFALLFFMSVAVRVKVKKWWKNTIIYKVNQVVGDWLIYIGKNISFVWKTSLIVAGIGIIEFICWGIFFWNSKILFILWVIEKIIFLPAIAIGLINLYHLQKGSQTIADGDLNYTIDTHRMFWEFKKHGENLNHISVGMQNAVEDRMKSEHFKTELITNVSHDIKTPLTSIINYVDLLEKEDIQNDTVKEYLEVLDRQSFRLKKLIEDLIEASKASTGSLKIQLEKCKVGVMLTQAAGEYEEKLKSNGMDLVLKQPEDEILIDADGRHLWRVFDNLMNNINKYAQPGTRVYMNLEKKDKNVEITFRNTSRYELNITGEELQERFVRGDSSRNTEGSGLGLSIARSLTELMNGTFELVVDGDLFKVILTFSVKC